MTGINIKKRYCAVNNRIPCTSSENGRFFFYFFIVLFCLLSNMYRIQYYWNKRSGPYCHLSTNAEKETRYIQYGQIFFASIIMYLTCTIIVLLKKYMVWHMFLHFLMFRKPNKTTINKNKTTILYRSTSFRFSFIFWYFKVFQVKRIVYI